MSPNISFTFIETVVGKKEKLRTYRVSVSLFCRSCHCNHWECLKVSRRVEGQRGRMQRQEARTY